ncbi:MAG TPA: exosortase/archaeosortase family protein [Candidatus Limnocylindrales bacterium]|nr:exosortase/archaeosortase family protein [Candidatus Limnocylindrales bacterium]
MNFIPSTPAKRWLIFGVWVLVSLLIFAKPVVSLVQLANQDESASHILLIPFISAWLLYSERKQELPASGFSLWPPLAIFVSSVFIGTASLYCASCAPKDRLTLYTLALILLLASGFVVSLGVEKAKSSWFGLAFLLFAVPLPDAALRKVIYWLQLGSAAVAELLFNLSGAPVLREGFVFRLPKFSIEVAQECSGIRSSVALLILAVLITHFSFRPIWKKITFVLAGLCMMLIKNGIRIATLTLLANYVNRGFLDGRLHHQGGIVFFLIGLGLLLPVYWLLRKGEVSYTPTGQTIQGQMAS